MIDTSKHINTFQTDWRPKYKTEIMQVLEEDMGQLCFNPDVEEGFLTVNQIQRVLKDIIDKFCYIKIKTPLHSKYHHRKS